MSKPLFVSKAIPHVDLNTSVGAIGLGSTFFLGLGRPPGCRSDGTGHLSTKITCNVENLSTLCGAPKRLVMVESGILFFRIFPCVPNFLFLTTDIKFIPSGYLTSKNQVGIEKIPALKFEISIVSFKPIFFIHAVVLLQIEN